MKRQLIQAYINTMGRFPSLNAKILNMALKAGGYNVHHQNSGEDLFVKSMDNPQFCVDVGANRGQYASLLLEHTNAKIISFEPNPIVFERLAKLAAAHPERLQAINKGVADKNTTLNLHHSDVRRDKRDGSGFGSFSEEVKQIPAVGRANTTTTSVEVIKLDDFALPQEIDLIKMDVEGFEYEVLKGMENIIRDKRVKYIQLEYNAHQFYRGHNLAELAKLMPGYRCYQLTRFNMLERDAFLPQTQYYALSNWVFVREDIKL